MNESGTGPRTPPWAEPGRARSPEHDAAAQRTAPPDAAPEDGPRAAPGDPVAMGDADERPGTASSALTAVLTGVLVGAVATAMHGNIWYGDGWWLPWGLVFSGLLLLSAGVWCGTSTRRVWAAAVPGLMGYAIAWAAAYLRQGSALVATSWSAPIGVVGILWFVVIFVAVMAAVIVTGRWLVRRRAR
ncbi:hypothetical protein [Kocuria tytonis]|uniref:hypothetical protein n=1 Tax=Kocuria tytonis TaxID=2054280 RepID=UPI001F28E7DF|nr:hypothetical protein [Kocuria tytonis]